MRPLCDECVETTVTRLYFLPWEPPTRALQRLCLDCKAKIEKRIRACLAAWLDWWREDIAHRTALAMHGPSEKPDPLTDRPCRACTTTFTPRGPYERFCEPCRDASMRRGPGRRGRVNDTFTTRRA